MPEAAAAFKPLLSTLNPAAWAIADRLAAEPARFGVEVHRLACGARVIDCGVAAPGGFAAGVEFSRACMGGLGEIDIVPWTLDDTVLAGCRVRTDHPLVACIASQYAGWKIQAGKFSAMGSGPARALAAAEPLFEKYALRVEAKQAVLLVESSALPDDEAAEKVAGRCGVAPEALSLLAAATGSTVGSVQIAARVVETALHKMMELGFDLTRIRSGIGFCPVPPVIRDPLRAIGRTNDAVLYGGEVHLIVDVEDEMLSGLAPRIPSSTSRDHGRLFYDLFREYGDFYKIDPMLFSPARISLANQRTGRTFRAGATSPELLRKSFGL
jgi:methenyltetrahydromethanopterin cyclohydrolase